MPKKKKKPYKIKVGGDTYTPLVLRVTDRDELGRPIYARLMRQGDSAHLSASDPKANEFIVVYAKEGT